jgi:hypothetical protein
MLTKNQIQVASCVLQLLEHEGATFAPTSVPSRGLSARETSEYLLEPEADHDHYVVEFREEAVCFSLELSATELATLPAECIARAMMVRRALVNMSSN